MHGAQGGGDLRGRAGYKFQVGPGGLLAHTQKPLLLKLELDGMAEVLATLVLSAGWLRCDLSPPSSIIDHRSSSTDAIALYTLFLAAGFSTTSTLPPRSAISAVARAGRLWAVPPTSRRAISCTSGDLRQARWTARTCATCHLSALVTSARERVYLRMFYLTGLVTAAVAPGYEDSGLWTAKRDGYASGEDRPDPPKTSVWASRSRRRRAGSAASLSPECVSPCRTQPHSPCIPRMAYRYVHGPPTGSARWMLDREERRLRPAGEGPSRGRSQTGEHARDWENDYFFKLFTMMTEQAVVDSYAERGRLQRSGFIRERTRC
ncbi:hypothetical protein BKA93DRAFT_751747 [Sparassis latifolia]